MYDLLNRVYTDIIIQPGMIENEHTALCEMVDRYSGSEKTIFIVDRGYESYKIVLILPTWTRILFTIWILGF